MQSKLVFYESQDLIVFFIFLFSIENPKCIKINKKKSKIYTLEMLGFLS